MTSTAASTSSNSTVYTPTVSSESGIVDLQQNHTLQSDIPTNGSTFIIQDVFSGHVICSHKGDIVLAPISKNGAFRWKCVETDGWFCFLEENSNKFLCHDVWNGQLKCNAADGDGYRHFTITLVPGQEGFVMSMLHYFKLRSLVTSTDNSNGFPKLVKDGQKLSDGIVWKFVKV